MGALLFVFFYELRTVGAPYLGVAKDCLNGIVELAEMVGKIDVDALRQWESECLPELIKRGKEKYDESLKDQRPRARVVLR